MTATHACDAPTTLPEVELRLAIIGAGPAGLSLALQAARALPTARITVFDARPADKDVRAALSEDQVREKFDLAYHTKHVDTIFKRVFGDA